MIDRFTDQTAVTSTARLVALLAVLSFLLLSFAQQGGIGSSLRPVPNRPLPFDRAGIFGVDLSDRSSAGAVQWLEQAGQTDVSLVVLPVDAEIVAAIADDQTADGGAAALRSLLEPVEATTIALCLHRPLTAQTGTEVLETIVELIRDEFSESIAYAISCDESEDGEWQATLSQVLDVEGAESTTFLPLTAGATVEREPIAGFQPLEVENLRSFAGDEYVMPRIPADAPPSPVELQLAQEALRNAAQISLILLRPVGDVDPASLASAAAQTRLESNTLVQGFNSVASAPVQWDDGWQPTQIGPIRYQRAGEPGQTLSTRFIGTSLYLTALLSPDGGRVAVWIDRQPTADTESADRIIELTAVQAQDGAIEIADELPAATHDVSITSLDGEVVISGLFVSGRPEHDWVTGLASVGLLLLAVSSLTVANMGRVRQIRRRIRPPRPPTHHSPFQRQSRQ